MASDKLQFLRVLQEWVKAVAGKRGLAPAASETCYSWGPLQPWVLEDFSFVQREREQQI